MTLDQVLTPLDVRQEIFVVLGLWSEFLNIENYSNEYFYNSSCDVHDFDPLLIAKKRNKFILDELKGLNTELKNINSILSKYGVNTHPRYIQFSMKIYWNDDSNGPILINSLKNESSYPVRSELIRAISVSEPLDSLLYITCFIYMDILKIKEFLLSKYNHSISLNDLPIENEQDEKEPERLKDLFETPQRYELVINWLMNNGIIDDDGHIIGHTRPNWDFKEDRTVKKIACKIGAKLKTENMVKHIHEEDYVKLIARQFNIKSITKAYFNDIKNVEYKIPSEFSTFLFTDLVY